VKAIITGMLLAAALATGAALILNNEVQSTAGDFYKSDAVRL
jgi:hypothetical protein